MRNIILVENLKKSYKSKVVVDDLCFSVKKGEFFGLLGHNGAGKSTTIDCILGLKNFESGTVRILDMNPKKSRKELFERHLQYIIGDLPIPYVHDVFPLL